MDTLENITRKCNTCQLVLSLFDFPKDNSNNSGYAYRCKMCNRKKVREYNVKNPDQQKVYRMNNKDAIRAMHRKKRDRYRKAWMAYFINKYGSDPICPLCDKTMTWIRGNMLETVCFDHRHGDNEVESPSRWLSVHPCENEYIKIFESYDFGIICHACNKMLPTINREEWLLKANKYVFGNKNVRQEKI